MRATFEAENSPDHSDDDVSNQTFLEPPNRPLMHQNNIGLVTRRRTADRNAYFKRYKDLCDKDLKCLVLDYQKTLFQAAPASI